MVSFPIELIFISRISEVVSIGLIDLTGRFFYILFCPHLSPGLLSEQGHFLGTA